MRLIEFFVNNSPSRKPQLWSKLPIAIFRKVRIGLSRKAGGRWHSRPCTVRLAGTGVKMEVIPGDAIGYPIYLYGEYERALTAFVRRNLKEGDVFIDVGANAGYFTLLAADLVGATGAVVAFEPVTHLREQMARSVRLNGYRHVTLRSEAVWRRSGSVPFFEAGSGCNSGLSSVHPGSDRNGPRRRVPCVTLSEVSHSIGRPIRLIKVDVEEAELDVLEGARDLLVSANAPVVAFESFDASGPKAMLEELGLELRRLQFASGGHYVLLPPWTEGDGTVAAYEAPTFVAATASRMKELLEVIRAH